MGKGEHKPLKSYDSDEESGSEVDNEERVEYPCLTRILNNSIFSSLMTFSLFFALFGHSLWNVLGIPDVPGNLVLDILMTTVSVLFILEITFQCLAIDGYAGSFFFWMDIIGTCSMVFEVSYLFGSSGHTKLVSLSNNAAITRTARAARLGARAVRFLRLVKAMALVTTGKDDGKNKGEDEIQLSREEIESKEIHEKLGTALSEKVSLLTILVVCVLPLLHFDQYPTEDYSMKAWAERLETSYGLEFMGTPSEGQTFALTMKDMSNFYEGMKYFPYMVEGFPAAGGGQSIPGEEVLKGKATPVRREFVVRVRVPVCKAVRPDCQQDKFIKSGTMELYNPDGTRKPMKKRAAVYFDFTDVVKGSATMDIVTIGLVLFIMVYFSHDVTRSLIGIKMLREPTVGEATV